MMTSETGKKGFPLWAKILIGVVVLGTVAVVSFIAISVMYIGNISKQSKDPVYIAKVASEVATIQQPLPPGFNYQMALDLAGMVTVVVDHKPDNTQITLVKFPQTAENKSAEELITDLKNKGFPSQGSSGTFEETSKGTETVAGETMPYVIGTVSTRTGQKMAGLIGCIVAKNHTKTVLFYGATPTGPYNMAATKEFLTAIKDF